MPDADPNSSPLAGTPLRCPSRADSWEDEWRVDSPAAEKRALTGTVETTPHGISEDNRIRTPIFTGMALAVCVVSAILIGMAVLNYGSR